MNALVRLEVGSVDAWRRWLERNHGRSRGVWLVFYKLGARGARRLIYSDALDEALCFGWIDSIVKRESDETYLRKFTPRTDAKKWSPTNLRRARALVRAGRMTEAGARVIGVPLRSAPRSRPPSASVEPRLPAVIRAALASRPKAAAFFAGLAPGYRGRYLGWILSAKQETTRARRLAQALDLLERGVKSLMK
jgi:uncharacterized protein YdeI (YjbR/CyaY-like superfamily)